MLNEHHAPSEDEDEDDDEYQIGYIHEEWPGQLAFQMHVAQGSAQAKKMVEELAPKYQEDQQRTNDLILLKFQMLMEFFASLEP